MTDFGSRLALYKDVALATDSDAPGTGSKPVIVDVVDPIWKVENINIDKTNKKVTADLIATDKYLTGVENSTLTIDDITLTIDGETNTVITKTLSAPTFSENASTGLKEIKYTLTLDNWEESARQAGKKFLEYSGAAKITIKAGTVTDDAGGKNKKPSTLFDKDGTNANKLHIGDFVDYDAGTWTQDEINSIKTGYKTSLVTANGSTNLPGNELQFGGFAAGTSRNESATHSDHWDYEGNSNRTYDYLKDTATNEAITGWRVFDVDEDNNVTLISAGNPEDYYQPFDSNYDINYSYISEYILTGNINNNWSVTNAAETYQKRDWGVYVNKNQKAINAIPLTKSRLDSWYSKYTDTENADSDNEDVFQKIYSDSYIKYQNLLDNNSWYWLGDAGSDLIMYNFECLDRKSVLHVGFGDCPMGIRMLVTLSSDVLFNSEKTGTKTLTGGNMDTYGGNQTYNCWSIATGSNGNANGENNSSKEQTLDLGHVDFIKPSFTYKYANTEINHDTKTVTVVFDITDKYFSASQLATDAVASNIKVNFEGKEATNATKELSKLSDITATINGTAKKVGEKYQLVVSNLDQGNGGDYSGIMTLGFNAGLITDTVGNQSVAKTITIGVDEPRKGVKPSELFDSTGSDTNKLHIGDFINYDAGTWTQEEINSIQTGLKTNLQTANGSSSLPSTAFKFGGFTAGLSRNGNATAYNTTYNYVKDASTSSAVTGWRVFDIDGDNVTLISAGNPEAYYASSGTNYGYINEYILTGNINSSFSSTTAAKYQKRDWGAYVNKEQKATSAIPLTKTRLDNWYTKYTGTSSANTYTSSTFQKIYNGSYIKYQNMIDNYSYSWLPQAYNSSRMYQFAPNNRCLSYNLSGAFGVRMLVTLSSDVRLGSEKTGTKTLTGGNMTTYGGNQTYNCWDIVENDELIVDVVDPRWKIENINIDKINQKVTADLIATDKYLTGIENSTLTTNDITLTVDGDENANNVITKALSAPTFSENAETGLKEIKYTLTLENWEESSRQAGKSYLEYSGSTNIKIAEGTITDDAEGALEPGQVSDGKSNTSKEQTFDLGKIDIISPTIEKVSSTANAMGQLATLTFNVSDKYLNADDVLTVNDIKILINGTASTTPTRKLTRVAEGDVTATVNGETRVVSQQYKVEISGYANNVNSVKVRVIKGAATDTNGNGNKQTDIGVYSVLKATSSETSATSGFLGNTSIQRQNIENITFENDIPKTVFNPKTNTYVDSTAWDVSARQDKSIIAWYEQSNSKGAIKVHIGSNDEIYANRNSSYLFAYIGYSSNCTATETITNLDLLNTESVVNMGYMFMSCGYNSMTRLDLGYKFNTENVTDMRYMFNSTGYNAMTSLKLSGRFKTTSVTNMNYMFYMAGNTAMETLDLGPAFIKIANNRTNIFVNTGKTGTVIYAPESIYKNETSFKLSSTDTSTAAGNIAVTDGRKIEAKYKPEWKLIKAKLNEDQSVTVTVHGQVNSANYTSAVTSNLSANDITLWIDGVEAKGISASVEKDAEIENRYNIKLSDFESAVRRADINYKDWSGNFALRIGGREEDTSTYTKNVLVDSYGNQNMSQVQENGAWVNVELKDTRTVSINTDGRMFADFVAPSIIYQYANTTIDHNQKTVTVIFDVTDKYFSTSTLSADTTASGITVNFEGKEATNATKTLTKLSDISAIVDGTSKKIGEKYQLVVSNLDQDEGGDYSGIMTLAFPADIATDLSNNSSLAKTITIGVDEPTVDGEQSGTRPSVLYDSTGLKADGLHIGDFINYDAGTWTQEEIEAIKTGEKTNLKTANGSTDLPKVAYQFGGFTAGASRNESATPNDSSYNYVKDASTNNAITGWRVFDIDGDNVTLISAGNPEDYYHPYIQNMSYVTEYILTGNINNNWSITESEKYQKREWGVYVNREQKAINAIPLTKSRLDNWYTKYTNTTNANSYTISTFQKIYQEPYIKYQNIIDNNSYYWFSEASNDYSTYSMNIYYRQMLINSDLNFGIRMLVTLSPDVLLSTKKTGTKTLTGGNMDTYGGNQTYNCWNIVKETSNTPAIVDVVDPVWKVENINVNSTNKKLTVDLIATDKYLTGVENSTLTTDDITLAVDGDENANNVITKTLSTPTFSTNSATGLKEIKYTLTLENWEESAKQSGKSYKEYSGYAKITIAAGTVEDDTTGETGAISDGKHNTNKEKTFDLGKVDLVRPSFIYRYADTTIDHDNKTVTIGFDVTDKYFNTSSLSADTIANNITIDFEGTEATNANKILNKITDIMETVEGNANTKVGERYQLVVSNLDQGNGGDYSGIMNLTFGAGVATDLSGNTSLAKTITIGIDDPSAGIDTNIGAKPSELFDQAGTNADGLHIGDFVNYDAGTWTQDEINSIQTGLKTDLQTANGSTDLPENGFQFGGFTAGSSRNGNAATYPVESNGVKYDDYLKDATSGEILTGWRVFDIDGDKITLISAGNPEDYRHSSNGDTSQKNYAYASEYILTGDINSNWSEGETEKEKFQKRDWGVYVNVAQKATSANPLTKSKLDNWYTKYTNTENADSDNESIFKKIYQEPYIKYQNMIENNSSYWISAKNGSTMSLISSKSRCEVYSMRNTEGIRMLVTLSPDVILSQQKTGTKALTGGNMDAYGGNQTYNCWDIVTDIPSEDPVIVDVVDPIWKVENVNIDKENKKVTADIVATDKYLTGVENSTLTTDDITISVDGDENANNVITKTLSTPTFSSNKTTGLKEIRYTLTLENWEESVKQAGKSFLEYSGSTKIKINAGTVVDDIGEIGNMKPSYLFDKNGTNEDGLHIGDFVDYDAGTWTQQEINSIQTGLKTSLQRANGSNSLPTNTYQFGGFTAGSSRNGSAIRAYMTSVYGNEYGSYLYDTSTNDILAGWRIFDIDGDTVTLISAGNPEDYYHAYDSTNNAFASQYILTGKMDPKWNKTESSAASTYQKRDWSVYVNSAQKAVSATPVTYSKINDWYEKYTKNGGTEGEINRPFAKLYNEPYIKYQNIADNYSVYWMITEQQYPLTVMRTK